MHNTSPYIYHNGNKLNRLILLMIEILLQDQGSLLLLFLKVLREHGAGGVFS